MTGIDTRTTTSTNSQMHVMHPPHPTVEAGRHGGILHFDTEVPGPGRQQVHITMSMMDPAYLRGLAKVCEELADEVDRGIERGEVEL